MAKRNKKGGVVYSTDPDFDYDNPFAALTGFEAPNDTGSESTADAGKEDRLRILLDRKGRGGKTVTLITGYQGEEEALRQLGKQLKSHCGVGGSTKDGEIVLQGDQRDKVVAWLKKEGYKDVKKSGG